MKNWWIGSLLVSLLFVPALVQSQNAQYQAGKVVSVKKLGDSSPTASGTDTPTKSETHSYDISIQVGDTIYVCRYQENTGELAAWLPDKEVQVRIKGKTIFVKRATGRDAKGSILRTTKAAQS